jgi:hypothetical protein
LVLFQLPLVLSNTLPFPMRTLLLALLLVLSTALQAQDITAFRNYLHLFDSGTFTELEPMAPRAYGTGGNYLVYAANNGDLKVYQHGTLRTIDQNIATPPFITDHYFGYVSAGVFRLYDGDTLVDLCRNTGGFVVEDSIAGYRDLVQRMLYIHYRGRTDAVEDALLDDALEGVRSGDNILAWVSTMTKELKAHYRGQVWVLESLVDNIRFWAGTDMVVYQDPSGNGLKVFYQGELMDLEAFMPTRVEMGRGLFAYVDASNALKVFANGKVQVAQSYAPEEFFVRDSLVVIKDQGQLRIYQNGTTTTVRNYFPELWQASWGTFAWLDVDGTIKAWHNGTISTVLQREPVKGFTLDRGIITINLTNNTVKVWWKGGLYAH